jgi:general secretion pathway protein K|tara:strand:- start:1816 stop:3066 length:1251 start_codon:yes stop_codon:yes gene_type:complete
MRLTSTYPFRGQQQGVALISILLIVVIATVLGAAMTTEQNFSINRARVSFDQSIVKQYALGGEELARQILRQDFIDSPEVDHLGEQWAVPGDVFEFEDGEIELQIIDLQSRMNVNGLASTEANNNGQNGSANSQLDDSTNGSLNGSPNSSTQDNDTKARLIRLFTQQGAEDRHVHNLKDWIDADDANDGLGAEDYAYLGLDKPYRTAGQLIGDISELRLLLEMEPQQFQLIAPYLVALPDVQIEVNVNTASAGVLQALLPGTDLGTLESLVADRDGGQPFESTSAFLVQAGVQGVLNGITVRSEFFQVSIKARYQDRFGYLTSIIQRDGTDGSMRVIYRDQSKKILPKVTEQKLENTQASTRTLTRTSTRKLTRRSLNSVAPLRRVIDVLAGPVTRRTTSVATSPLVAATTERHNG